MNHFQNSWKGLLLALFLFAPFLAAEGCEVLRHDPIAVYLTWQQSPETTMTVHWISSSENRNDRIVYRKRGKETRWKEAVGEHDPLPQGHDELLIHTTEITNLNPNTAYEFCVPHSEKLFFFRTMPTQLDEPIRFVVGGDIYHDELKAVRETSQQAAKTDPMFALLGGDIAYAADKFKRRPELYTRWLEFLHSWQEDMITKDGFLVPILPTTSNEDTEGRYGQTPADAPFFFALFASPGLPGYKVLDFSDYLSIWLLDTGHTNPINGVQKEWIRATLSDRKNIPNRIAVYHCPAFPGYRDPMYKMAPHIREHWVPIFEEEGLDVAFEHHDHAYKRTHRVKNGSTDPSGVLYLGDGGWGESNPRQPGPPEERWYLAATASFRHFIAVTLDNNKRLYRAINYLGEEFDRFEEKINSPEPVLQ